MKNLLSIIGSLSPQKRMWERYRRFRQVAWKFRREMKAEESMVAHSTKAFSELCLNGSTSPLLTNIVLSQNQKNWKDAQRVKPQYEWFNRQAEISRFIFFLLRGKLRFV